MYVISTLFEDGDIAQILPGLSELMTEGSLECPRAVCCIYCMFSI